MIRDEKSLIGGYFRAETTPDQGTTGGLCLRASGEPAIFSWARKREMTAAPSPAARPTNAAAAAATGAAARFYALPPGDASATPTVVALYAFHSGSGELAGYVAEPDPVPDGCRRAEAPVCRVWRRPLAAHLRFDPCEAQPADAPALAPR